MELFWARAFTELQAPNDMSATTNHLHLCNFYTFTSYNIECDWQTD